MIAEEKINVLVFGNSGVGKSTLINHIFHTDQALTGTGVSVTEKLEVYENEEIPFRIIDTMGLDYNFWSRRRTIQEIRKWTEDGIRRKNQEKYVHVIWYCISGADDRIFKENLDMLDQIEKIWKGIPIIVVFTKTFSETLIPKNEQMFITALQMHKKKQYHIRGMVSVLAEPYDDNQDAFGLDQLIEKTNEIVPVAQKMGKERVAGLQLMIKRKSARAATGLAAASAAAVGAVPIPCPDAPILMALQSGLAMRIIGIYGFSKGNAPMRKIVEILLGTSMSTVAAKTILSYLKAIPGLNIAAAVLNAAVAGTMTALIGEIITDLAEGIASGKISAEDLEWIKKFVESRFKDGMGKYLKILEAAFKSEKPLNIAELVKQMVSAAFGK